METGVILCLVFTEARSFGKRKGLCFWRGQSPLSFIYLINNLKAHGVPQAHAQALPRPQTPSLHQLEDRLLVESP